MSYFRFGITIFYHSFFLSLSLSFSFILIFLCASILRTAAVKSNVEFCVYIKCVLAKIGFARALTLLFGVHLKSNYIVVSCNFSFLLLLFLLYLHSIQTQLNAIFCAMGSDIEKKKELQHRRAIVLYLWVVVSFFFALFYFSMFPLLYIWVSLHIPQKYTSQHNYWYILSI